MTNSLSVCNPNRALLLRWEFALAVFAAISVASSTAVLAAGFSVVNFSDAPDAAPGDGNCAPVSGGCTLRAAVEEANASSGADSVTLPAGKFKLSSGELQITSDLNITGVSADTTIIDGKLKTRVFHLLSSASASLSKLTIQKGSSQSSPGAVLIDVGATAHVSEVRFVNNRSSSTGGAVFNQGVAVFTNVTFSNNRRGALWNGGTLTLTNATFRGNRSIGGCGAFLNAGTATLRDVSFKKNRATSSAGALSCAGKTTLTNVTFVGNFVSGLGGGVHVSGGDSITTLTNVTFSGNRASDVGGAIAIVDGTVNLTNVTIARNRAKTSGAGLHSVNADTTLKNTIVADNGVAGNCSGTTISAGHNLDSGATCGFSAAGDLSNSQPSIDKLRENGGATLTHALLPGSPAIDAGDDGVLGPPLSLATDQRGLPRKAGASVDIGAYEVQ